MIYIMKVQKDITLMKNIANRRPNMARNSVNDEVVDKFISKLDVDKAKEYHDNSAYYESFVADWNQMTLQAVLRKIAYIYKDMDVKNERIKKCSARK